jgi:hypothetical protein
MMDKMFFQKPRDLEHLRAIFGAEIEKADGDKTLCTTTTNSVAKRKKSIEQNASRLRCVRVICCGALHQKRKYQKCGAQKPQDLQKKSALDISETPFRLNVKNYSPQRSFEIFFVFISLGY